MSDDSILIAQITDKTEQTASRYMITWGTFLDSHQRKVVKDYLRTEGITEVSGEIRCLFYGGYEDAERCIPCFLPDYAKEDDLKDLLSVIRVNVPSGGRALTHRDYLGSLLSLGIDRNVTGDILVRKNGADIIVLSSIGEFILMNYSKAGRQSLDVEMVSIDEIDRGSVNIVKRSDTVASLRLDSIVASAFKLSRAKAKEAVKSGLVALNGVEETKIDAKVQEKDKLVLRGKGKVILSEIGGTSRKERHFVTYDEYR